MKSKKIIWLIFSYIVVAIFVVIAVAMFMYWRHLVQLGYDQVDMQEFYNAYASDYID